MLSNTHYIMNLSIMQAFDYSANSPARLATLLFLLGYLIWMYWNLNKAIQIYHANNEFSEKWVIMAILSLVTGDTIHEIYLIWSYFENDIALYGFGFTALMLTSIFMSGYYFFLLLFQRAEFKNSISPVGLLGLLFVFLVRIIHGVLPENEYANPTVEGYTNIRILSNVAFCAFGLLILSILLWNARQRATVKDIYFITSAILGFLSFLFYILHLLLYPVASIFGMFMLPKSIAYMAEVYYLVVGISIKRQ